MGGIFEYMSLSPYKIHMNIDSVIIPAQSVKKKIFKIKDIILLNYTKKYAMNAYDFL